MGGQLLALLLLLAGPASSFAARLDVTLQRVVDGDTVNVLDGDNKIIRVRMRYIDAPERSQKYGKESTNFLKDVIGSPGQNVQLEVYKKDRYGRTIGVLYSGGDDVNKMMVDNGYAWCYLNKCPEDYKIGVELSKQEKIGLFADPNPMTPWDYRKSKKKKKPILTTDQIIEQTPILRPLPSSATRMEVKLISVLDGDTIKVKSVKDNKIVKIRFLFIDAPEKSQAAGKDSKNFLANYLNSKKKLVIRVKGIDRYNRVLGIVMLGRRDVNKLMVADGYAWCYKTGCPSSYKSAMVMARQQARGLWEADNPQAPWYYRKYGAPKTK